jgi:hypothetical protein
VCYLEGQKTLALKMGNPGLPTITRRLWTRDSGSMTYLISRSAQALALGALLTVIAFAAQPIAAAALDSAAYDKCRNDVNFGIATGTIRQTDSTYSLHKCCQDAGGVPTENGNLITCAAPPATEEGNVTPPTEPRVTLPRVPGNISIG